MSIVKHREKVSPQTLEEKLEFAISFQLQMTFTTKIFIVSKKKSCETLVANDKGFWMKKNSTKYAFIL